MRKIRIFAFVLLGASLLMSCTKTAKSTLSQALQAGEWVNPVFDGWYADPEGIIFDDELWIFPTYSRSYSEQTFLDAFSTRDMKTWVKHPSIIDNTEVKWLWQAMWAPAIVQNGNRWYLFFAGNDIQHEGEIGGIGVAVSDTICGPYHDLLGKPLISFIQNGAQPIDQFVFRDPKSGQWYMYYGGWLHCNVVRLSDDFTHLVAFDDGEMVKEITPERYVEGPFMFFRNGKYYFMWSEGGWTGPDYCVGYGISDSPFGPFVREGKILESDLRFGTGAGHHSVVFDEVTDQAYIIYHRHPLEAQEGNDRVVCVDRLMFDSQGKILPVQMH